MEKSMSFATNADVIAVSAVLVPVSQVLPSRQANMEDNGSVPVNEHLDRVNVHPKKARNSGSNNTATKTISARRQRKQLQHGAHQGHMGNPYLHAMAVLGTLYLVAILALACWECLISPMRVQRLNEASLAVPTGVTPFEYSHGTLTHPSEWTSDTGGSKLPVRREMGTASPSEPRLNYRHIVDDSLPVALFEGGKLQPPRPTYSSNEAATQISAQHGELADGTLFYRCGNLAKDHDAAAAEDAKKKWTRRSREPKQSRDVVFLSAKTFFKKHKHGDAILLMEGKSGERAFMELCHRATVLSSGVVDSITVLDINDSVPPETIYNVLQGLLDMDLLSMVPVAALVTPGASARTIVDWILHGEDDDLRALKVSVARNWISVDADMSAFEVNPQYGNWLAPQNVVYEGDGFLVTTDSTAGVDETDWEDEFDENDTRIIQHASTEASEFTFHVSPLLRFTGEFGGWPILAVHGEMDEVGKKNCGLLRDRAQGVLAIIGGVGANVLVEAPVEFGEAMFTYLEQESSFHSRTFRKEI